LGVPANTWKTAVEEKEVLNGWITKHAGDPMYRFGHQQAGDVVDPSSQTEDLVTMRYWPAPMA